MSGTCHRSSIGLRVGLRAGHSRLLLLCPCSCLGSGSGCKVNKGKWDLSDILVFASPVHFLDSRCLSLPPPDFFWLFQHIHGVLCSNPAIFIEKTHSAAFHSHSDDCWGLFWGQQYKFSSTVSLLVLYRATRSDCFHSLLTFSDLQIWMSREIFILHQSIRMLFNLVTTFLFTWFDTWSPSWVRSFWPFLCYSIILKNNEYE